MARGFRMHSSAVFNPFDYQQMLAPLAQAQTAYNQMQDSLLASGEEANQYRQLIDNDEWASNVLKRYTSALEDATDRLNKEGLRGTNRSTLMRLRKTYNDTVKPVNDAAKTLAEIQNTYRQAYAKDNTMMRGAMPSIRELVENPNAMPQMVSGVQLYNQGAAASKAASLRQFKNSEFGKKLIHGYFELSQERGYSPEVVNAFMMDASQIPELAAEIANIQQMYNTAGLQDPQQANRFIMQGILDGIQYNKSVDYKYDQMGAEMRAAARKGSAGAGGLNSVSLLKPVNIYSQRERSKAAKNIDRFQDMFEQKTDGSWVLSNKGKEAYEREKRAAKSYNGAINPGSPGFSADMFNNSGRIGLSGFINSIKKEGETPEQTWARYYNENSGETYDAHKDTGYRFIPQSDDGETILNLIKGHGATGRNNDKIALVDFNPKTKQYEETNDTIDSKDLKTVVDLDVTQYGIVATVLDKNNKEVTVKYPKVSPVHHNAIISNSRKLHDFEDKWESLLNNLGYPEGAEPSVEEVIYATGDAYGENAAIELDEAYQNYIATQQSIYNNLANTYRTGNAKASEL